MTQIQKKKVVVIGGGTGIYPVTTALKHLNTDISTIVAVSDSGGSTGRIRDEFGFQPVGDLRQSLAALAEDEGQEWIRKLLLYRFEKGTGLKGHNLGNLILTALQDMTGNTNDALEKAQTIFRLEGQVIPTTTTNVDLKIHYTDGSTDIGEDILDQKLAHPKEIDHISLEPNAQLNPEAQQAIIAADFIIIGPGDFYASLMAALAPSGIKKAFKKSQAKVTYLLNLMTRVTQTKDMSAGDHISEIEEIIGKQCDYVIMNNSPIPDDIKERYASAGEYPVENDLNGDKRIIKADILNDAAFITSKHDTAHRSVLRHDSQKLLPVLKSLITKK